MTGNCPSCAQPLEEGVFTCRACGRVLPALVPGDVFAARYLLRSVIGEGGLGAVYRALDRERNEEVALKVFRTDLLASAEAVRRFRAEIEQARQVSHPNVCPILAWGEAGPLAYLATEILAGEDLHKTIERSGRLPEAEALSAVLQIASGLQAIHGAGILHGDLKTAHAVRDEQGVVRIVPFGLAKDPLSADESVGSLAYMSPEHCWGYPLDPRSDEYALAVVAFELLTGEVPLRGVDPADTLLRQMRETPSFDQEPGSRIPRGCVPALSRALAKTPAERFASVEEFAQALRLTGPDAAVAPSAPTPPIAAPSPAPPLPTAGAVQPPPPPALETPGSARPTGDTRRDERFEVPTDVVLRKVGPGGVPQKEERTIAHDLSRSGMRILTSWSDLQLGDDVAVQEVSGDFVTAAVVRHVSRGTDHITRVGVEFVGNRAPDRLVGTTTTIARPAFVSSSASRGPSAPPPRAATDSGFRAGASAPTFRPGYPEPPRTPTSTARPESPAALTSSVARPGGPMNLTTSIPRPAVAVNSTSSTPRPAPASALSTEEALEQIAALRLTAQNLASESKIWEALDRLAKAQALAAGTPEERVIQILTWETQAKIPSLMRAAHQNLEDLARSEPQDVGVHSALGRIFWEAGLAARARVAFNRVITLDPLNREAAAALAVLNDPKRRR